VSPVVLTADDLTDGEDDIAADGGGQE
jgi:hypothetical protein